MMNCDNFGCEKVASKHCARCKSVSYCSVVCQREAWNAGHKLSCQTPKSSGVNFVFAETLPSKIWYADKPLNEGGIEQQITIQEFMEIYQTKMGEKGEKFEFTETLWVNGSFKRLRVSNAKDLMMVQEVIQLLQAPLIDSIAICYVNKIIGFAAYARKDIPALSLLAIYAGKIFVRSVTDNNDDDYMLDMLRSMIYPLNKTYAVTAKQRGGISRFFCHLPRGKETYDYSKQSRAQQVRTLRLHIPNIWSYDKGFVQHDGDTKYILNKDVATILNISQREIDLATSNRHLENYRSWQRAAGSRLSLYPGIDEYVKNDVKAMMDNNPESIDYFNLAITQGVSESDCLTANLAYTYVVIDGYPVPFFFSKRPILRGEILGFDYGHGYWFTRKRMPYLFDKQSKLVAENRYYYDRALIYHPVEGSGYFIHRKQYFECLSKQQPIQVVPFTKPLSFFAVRDVLVSCRVIPKMHAMIENNCFATQIERLLCPIIFVKSYYQNPEADSVLERHTVDVVCYFPKLLYWENFTDFIKSFFYAEIDFFIFSQITKEVIFKNVNVELNLYNRIIHSLQRVNLLQVLNQKNGRKEPGDFCYKVEGQYICKEVQYNRTYLTF